MWGKLTRGEVLSINTDYWDNLHSRCPVDLGHRPGLPSVEKKENKRLIDRLQGLSCVVVIETMQLITLMLQ